MPDPLIHITVAVLAVWLFYDKKYRHYALLLFPLAVLPDIDHFIPNEHRILLHNLFIILPVLAIALYARLKAKNVVLYNIALIASFFLLSHVVLDFFTDAGVPLFYPLIAAKYAFTDQLLLTHGSLALVPEQPAPFVQSELLGIILTGLIVPLSLFVVQRLPFGERCCEFAKA
jgi:hypothetical protein